MGSLWDAGIAWTLAIQQAGDWLAVPMRGLSYLGTEEFFFLVLPLLYWCIDSSLGLRVGLILVTSDVLNFTFKLAFAGPRPYWLSSHVRGLWPETSFGIPSGHSQHAMSVWGIIALKLKRPWAWVAAGLLILSIGISRVYLGAHFPQDVLVGWLIGALLLAGFGWFSRPVVVWFGSRGFAAQVLAAFLVSLTLASIGYGAAALRMDFQVPEQWITNALRAGPPPAPVDAGGAFSSSGTLFGLVVGAAWMQTRGGYRADGPAWKRFLRYLPGLAGVLILWMGLGAVLPRGDAFVPYLLRYLRYALVGAWVAAGAPWAFRWLGLSGRPGKSI